MTERNNSEIMLGEHDLPFFTNAKGVLLLDGSLVRYRFYSPDGGLLLADWAVTPAGARTLAARLISAANLIDPQGAISVVAAK